MNQINGTLKEYRNQRDHIKGIFPATNSTVFDLSGSGTWYSYSFHIPMSSMKQRREHNMNAYMRLKYTISNSKSRIIHRFIWHFIHISHKRYGHTALFVSRLMHMSKSNLREIYLYKHLISHRVRFRLKNLRGVDQQPVYEILGPPARLPFGLPRFISRLSNVVYSQYSILFTKWILLFFASYFEYKKNTPWSSFLTFWAANAVINSECLKYRAICVFTDITERSLKRSSLIVDLM